MGGFNGLKPYLAASKGIGWGRALPAPFDFGKGFFPDGTNDSISIPSLVGTTLPSQYTVEFWVNPAATGMANMYMGHIKNSSSQTFSDFTLNQLTIEAYTAGSPTLSLSSSSPKTLVTISIDTINLTAAIYKNGNYPVVGSKQNLTLTSTSVRTDRIISEFRLFLRNQFGNHGNVCMDEFRFYSGIITEAESYVHYNNGIGENPAQTETLKVWYKFEQFENLGSPLVGGFPVDIYDHSGYGNHGRAINAVTDPSSASYGLKTF